MSASTGKLAIIPPSVVTLYDELVSRVTWKPFTFECLVSEQVKATDGELLTKQRSRYLLYLPPPSVLPVKEADVDNVIIGVISHRPTCSDVQYVEPGLFSCPAPTTQQDEEASFRCSL
ncbi:hypothetical protein E2C01_092624 [Portunus trituberculatus]|uniref:Uncharacterized protein n=1 Tax=Portunus trituberculatus TaxID=210409 RepID=A0A5B7JS86_PORTR|nr:hypothetical protein [Portunus trituberculatus]